ncbi:MAG: dehydrogenase E1 component subunit alpha/beta [Cyclobacteriaceae bacterium]
MKFDRKRYSDDTLIDLYRGLLKPRMIEEKMIILLRQGKISKWFSGIGQEAVSVGCAMALKPEEYILPMHRTLGIFTMRNVPLNRLFGQFQGKNSGFTQGRDRSFHFGSNEHRIVGMISHLGPQLSVADGIALSNRINEEQRVTLVFTGDGGASEGEFHEALNVAAVWDLPVIFVVENNGYGLSTPSSEQFRFKSFTEKGPGYGIEAVQVDGNNVLEVYDTVSRLARGIRRKPRPILIEALTFRMRGHEEASGTKYVPDELMKHWADKDPVVNFEKYLLKENVLTDSLIEEIRAANTREIEEGLATAYAEDLPEASSDKELGDLFKPLDVKVVSPASDANSEKRYVDAISDGLRQSMERYDNLVLMGQDIAEYGGVFKVTDKFVETFGRDRVRNTPLCESAILGIGLGLSVAGQKSMIEMQFADFVSCGFNQIVNNLAKAHYRWGQHADVVIRMPTGAGVGAGPYHSQSNEAWFFHTPGLKIVYPSNPYDAKGLLTAAIEDPNPVLYFEHKYLYRSLTAPVPDDYYTLPIGEASLVQEGSDISVITYGLGVHWALEAAKEFPDHSFDILDLRSLMPWDNQAVEATVQKTNRALILHEDTLSGGIGGEIASWIGENLFRYLDAPVMRCGSLDTPVPFSAKLEENFLPKGRLRQKIKELLEF